MRPTVKLAKTPDKRAAQGTPAGSAESGDAGGSALHKGFSLLEALVLADQPATLADLAVQLGVPKATAHRLLSTLEAAGLLKRDLSGRGYLLGDRAVQFSLRAASFHARTSSVRIILEGLVAEVGETVNLGILAGSEVSYIDRVECNWPLRYHLGAGSRVPLYCTATGKLFLAMMPAARRRLILDEIRMPALTPHTITDRKKLEQECERIREERVAYNNQENMLGLIGLSVPIFDPGGEMVAGLAVHAPLPRLTLESARAHVPTLRRAAEKLARTLR